MTRLALFMMFLLLSFPSGAYGQSQEADLATPLTSESPYTEPLVPPMPVSTVHMPLTFSSETSRSNIVRGAIQLGSGYDDNALMTPSDHSSNVSFLALPTIEIQQNRERLNLDFAYALATTVNQQLTAQNQAAHSLSFIMNYRLTPHINVQLRDNFTKTNNLFAGLFETTPTPGPLQQSNSSVITPLAENTGNNSGIGFTYQLSPNSIAGASGNFYFTNYGAVSGTHPTYGFIDSQSTSADGFYARRFSRRQWVGVAYNFQQLVFDPGGRTTVHRALGFYSVSIASRVTVSLWAGPQTSTTFVGTVPQLKATEPLTFSSQWAPAAGIEFAWQGSRTSFRANYLRQVTDGGGMAEAVTLQQVSAEVKQRLAARWTASAGAANAANNPLRAFSASTPLRSLQGNLGIEYRITDNFGVTVLYGRQQQRYKYALLPSATANQNRVWLYVSYSFARPVGR